MLTKNKVSAIERLIRYYNNGGRRFTSSMMGLPSQTLGSLSKNGIIKRVGVNGGINRENLYILNHNYAVTLLNKHYQKTNKEKLSVRITFLITPTMENMITDIASTYNADLSTVLRAMINGYGEDYNQVLGVELNTKLDKAMKKEVA